MIYLAKTDLFLQISLFVPLIIAFSAFFDAAFLQNLFGKNLKLTETLCTISRYSNRDQSGPNGPNVAKQRRMGSNGAKQGQIELNRATTDPIGVIEPNRAKQG